MSVENKDSKMTTPIIPSNDTNFVDLVNNKDILLTRDLESGLEEEKSDSEYVCETCLYCNLCIFGLALIAGCLAYMVFGIMFLIQDYNVANDCKGSNLWEYALVACILSLSRCNANNANDKDSGGLNLGILICLGLIEAGLGIWGGIELFSNSCDDLSDSNLWKFCLATFILQSFLAFLCLIALPIIGCIIASKN